jgi:hypothetical protein
MGLIDKFREKFQGRDKPRKPGNAHHMIPSPEIEALRQNTWHNAYRVPGSSEAVYDLSQEQREQLIAGLEKQYQKALLVLKKYALPFASHHNVQVPTWEQIKAGLTPGILDKVAKLREPLVLMIPGTEIQDKIDAINYNARPHSFESRVQIPDHENIELWNGGSQYMHAKWRIGIAEGQPEIEADPKISGDNYEMAQSWLLTYQGQGLDVINDLDTFLVLIMHAQAAKKPLNVKTLTVLNAKNLKPGERLGYGKFDGDQVYLGTAHSNIFFKNIRLRPIVWVNPAQAA